MQKEFFGELADGQSASLYTFENSNGLEMTVSDLGATLVKVLVPDKNGVKRDVVLGWDDTAGYLNGPATYFGATVGRSANRTEHAQFELNGTTHHLTPNERQNNLHSGPNGYQLRLWQMKNIDEEQNAITFQLISPDGDQGYPGQLDLSVTYQLTADNAILITYEGLSEQDTVFNLTNHSYFNLAGHDSGTILDHELQIQASHFTPVEDEKSIPTGEIRTVSGTPMDFLTTKPIGQDIDADYDQLVFTGGYDHNYVLDKTADTLTQFATATSKESGITMKVSTDLPGVQFYAGNFIEDVLGKDDVTYQKRSGFCLETQYFPNAINELAFTSPILEAGKKLTTQTSYQFLVE